MNDITRCHGLCCEERDECLRYLTMAIDPKDGLFSYMERAAFTEEDGCLSKIPFAKETQQYRIDHTLEEDCIVCLICGKASYNQKDIEHKYCGHCHTFLE
jgi:hypothetical protein